MNHLGDGSIVDPLCSAAKELRRTRSKAASAAFLRLAFPHLEKGVDDVVWRHLRRGDPREPVEADFVQFLREKLDDDAFLLAVQQARNPAWLLRTSVANFIVTQFRARSAFPGEIGLSRPRPGGNGDVSDARSGADEVESSSPEDPLEASEEVDERRALASRELAALSPGDLLMVKVLHAGTYELTDAELELLAQRRGIPVSEVVQELDQRKRGIDERLEAAQARIDLRRRRVRTRQQKVRRLAGCMLQLGEEIGVSEPATPADDPPGWTTQALSNLSSDQRARLLAWTEHRLAEAERLLREALCEAADKDSASSGWKEVARILGWVHDGMTPEERKTAINTLTSRYRHVRARLVPRDPQGRRAS